MPATDIAGTTALVTGASRGFGRGIATSLSQAGAQVVGVARDHDQLQRLRAELGDSFIPVTADATGPATAGQLIDAYRPAILVLNAGATPLPRPLHHHTWQTFSQNWDIDVQHVFRWVREALLSPLDPGSTVITISSGAALRGSPLSGGYAGAKAAIRFITAYAADESERAGLAIRFRCVLPQLTPATTLGSASVAAYAARQGVDVASYLKAAGPTLTVEQAGTAITSLITDPGHDQDAYLLTPAGLTPAPG
jgi:NAD(P)-dependent dehydrogenase (short-subunit alcohol dehydrogenase family)